MENISKSLLIAGGVLIGILIITLAVSLYASLSTYVESAQEDMQTQKIQEFNVQFTKYINYNKETNEKDFTLTIQDIITAVNLAYENNTKYDLANYEEGNYYVTVNIMQGEDNPKYANLEKEINSKWTEILASELENKDENGHVEIKEYKCSIDDVKFDSKTGRVYQIDFYEL